MRWYDIYDVIACGVKRKSHEDGGNCMNEIDILIVEDDPSLQEAIQDALAMYKTVCASDGEEALQVLESNRARLVMCK